MKRETFRHPKTLDLAARLGVQPCYAFAHVAYLLNECADIAPQGNIGKWPNGVIALSAQWTGDPDKFVQALVESRWLDPCAVNRLVIHDLEDHIERWWKLKLEKLKLPILKAQHSIEATVEATAEATAEASPSRDQTKPNQTEPNPATPAVAGGVSESSTGYSKTFELWYSHYPRKTQKQAASAAFGRALKRIANAHGSSDAEASDWLCTVTESFAKSPKGQGDYVPYPATWLNEGRFDDDPKEWNRESSSKPPPPKPPATAPVPTRIPKVNYQ